MKYENVCEGIFVSRSNRFVATVIINGNEEVCHVKNTGRLRELLTTGAKVFVTECDKPGRKTRYDLIAVYKGDVLYNIDSQMPNAVFSEYLGSGALFDDITKIKPESTYGDSRFDFYVEHGGKKAFIEVKGVTLERGNVMLFPDAPSSRGIKHLNCLSGCFSEGYEAYVVFVVGAHTGEVFMPNEEAVPQFAAALRAAKASGVHIIAKKCIVHPGEVTLAEDIAIKL